MPVKTKKITLHLKPEVICERYPARVSSRKNALAVKLDYIDHDTNRLNAGTDFDVTLPPTYGHASLPLFKKVLSGDAGASNHYSTDFVFIGDERDRATLLRVLEKLEKLGVK